MQLLHGVGNPRRRDLWKAVAGEPVGDEKNRVQRVLQEWLELAEEKRSGRGTWPREDSPEGPGVTRCDAGRCGIVGR